MGLVVAEPCLGRPWDIGKRASQFARSNDILTARALRMVDYAQRCILVIGHQRKEALFGGFAEAREPMCGIHVCRDPSQAAVHVIGCD